MRNKAITNIGEEKYFRWRGKEVSRTENLSDIVFAMALTLIVASSVPSSFDALLGLWREAVAITLCFAMLLLIWRIHYVFFRRYDLEDGRTVFLNSVLILLIMLFAYPLKFLALFLVNYFTGGFETGADISAVLTLEQAPALTYVFAGAYSAVFVVFALMYVHALKLAPALGLSEPEIILTNFVVKDNIARVGIAGVVVVLCLALPGNWKPMANIFYFLGSIYLGILRRQGQAAAKQAVAHQEVI